MSKATKTLRQPRLSDLGTDLLHLTQWQLTRTIAWPFLAFVAYWIFAWSGQWVFAVGSLVVLSFVTYGSTSHDLVHGSLGLKSLPNDLLLSAIELISLRSGHAYQAAHLNHHAKFPHDDIEAEASRMSLLRAVLEGFIFQFRIYFWALRTQQRRRNWILAEGFGVSTIVLSAIAAWPWTIAPTVYVGLMIAGSWAIPLVTSYLPHDPNAADMLHQTRLFRGPLIRCIAFDHLYHLEHHLYPVVPHQNWPRLASRLDPWFAAMGIQPVCIASFSHLPRTSL
jgi:beta-carotene hydroxylase